MDADGERSLQGTSVPKWMRRPAERYGFEDMCASPPTNPDGFFHMRKLRQEKANAEQSVCSEPGDCLQKRKDAAGSSIQIEQHHHHHQGAVNISRALANMEKASWMKGSQGILGGFQLHRYGSDQDCSAQANLEGPQSALTNSSSAVGGGLHKTVSASSLLNIHSESPAQSSDTSLPNSPTLKRRDIGGKGGGVDTERKEEMRMAMSEVTKGTRLAAADEGEQIVPAMANIPSVIVTKPVDAGHDDSGIGLLSLIEKRLLIRRQSKSAPCTPETSPNATPAVSPCSSPQMGRRSGNPFFTGSSASTSGSVSWLFRPAQQEVRPSSSSGSSDRSNNIFYESKVEVQVNPATKTVNKNVRYVPRPSELRELNFWSPTSM